MPKKDPNVGQIPGIVWDTSHIIKIREPHTQERKKLFLLQRTLSRLERGKRILHICMLAGYYIVLHKAYVVMYICAIRFQCFLGSLLYPCNNLAMLECEGQRY